MKKTTENRYDPNTIEPIWQSKWEIEKIYHPDLQSAKLPFYNLMMFPYPSAEGLHIGGTRTFAGVDIYGRFKRMQGYSVFQPFGLDGFGIHAENYALKIGQNPMTHAKITEENFYRQIRESGIGVDWDRTVETYKPDYYKWTQWLFTELFKAGLAYRKKSPVNFCPSCKTVLADEQVIQKSIKSTTGITGITGQDENVAVGVCERCETPVEKKNLEQWFFRITHYADRLLNNIEGLDWTEKVKIAQRNWIGRSEGANVRFKIKDLRLETEFIKVFTTAIDTIYGVTFMVISPENPLVAEILKQVQDDKIAASVNGYLEKVKSKSDIERAGEGKEKTGVFSGAYVINPFNNQQVPVWVADYVLMGYGTGAVMGVPGHDARDHEFATKFGLPIKPVVRPKIGIEGAKVEKDGFWDYIELKTKYAQESELFDSGEFSGMTSFEAKTKLLSFISQKGFGDKTTTYHLRDWLISRQRYWGPPIPMIFCKSCSSAGLSWFDTEEAREKQVLSSKYQVLRENDKTGSAKAIHNTKYLIHNTEAAGWFPVPENALPVELPYIKDFKPLGAEASPLGNHPEFYNVKCPHCGSDARRETDVSDTFLDSSWYFLRYLATDRDDIPFPMLNPKSEARNPKQTQNTNNKNSKQIGNLKFEIGNSSQRLAWLPVHMYIGGAEHSVLHLLYARFITMFLKDQKLIEFEEPFKRFYAHGLIIKDGAKMSKSKGNVVGPDIYIKKYGADTLRMYLHFLAPFNQEGDFKESGVEGMNRFLKRVWTMFTGQNIIGTEAEPTAKSVMHQTIKSVTEDMEGLRFNTAIAHLMTYYNFLSKQAQISFEEMEVYLKLLAPFAPHMAEELWERVAQVSRVPQVPRGQKALDTRGTRATRGTFNSIHTSPWPTYDEKYLVVERIIIPIQVNGKLRGTIEIAVSDIENKEMIESEAKKSEKVLVFLQGHSVKKFVYIPGKVANFVV